jgi:hypothetical protein
MRVGEPLPAAGLTNSPSREGASVKKACLLRPPIASHEIPDAPARQRPRTEAGELVRDPNVRVGGTLGRIYPAYGDLATSDPERPLKEYFDPWPPLGEYLG